MVVLLVPALLASRAAAQDRTRQLEKEAEFLRKIARDLGFVSLAQDEVDRLVKANADSAQLGSVLQLDIEIKLIGAKRLPERAARRQLYRQALTRSDELIAKHHGDAAALRAKFVKVDAAYEFGQFLADELEAARLDDPDRVKPTEDEAAQLYRDGVDTCDEIMGQLGRSGGEQRSEYLKCWLYKGILLREHARAVARDRAVLCQRAHDTLEDMILTIGEESVIGQRGLFELAKVQQVLGRSEEAARAFRESAEASFQAAMDPSNELKGAAFDIVAQTMEEAYDKLTSTLLDMGKPEEVLRAAAEYREKIRELRGEEGHEDPRYGHMVYLTEARALAETGDAAKAGAALDVARKLNDQHPNDIVGLRAKELLKEILATQPDAAKAADLLEIARGEQQSKRFDEAVRGYKRALAAMRPEEGPAIGLEAWHQMGLAFAAQDRFLEAVLAMRHGLEAFPPADEDEGAGSDVANHMKAALDRLLRASGHDPAFEALGAGVTELVRKHGGRGSEARLWWEEGRQKLEEKLYLEAAEAFGKIPAGSIYYELGRARQATAYQVAGLPDKARATIAAFREWQAGKEARVDRNAPGAGAKLENRKIANAECDFVEGYLLYLEAIGHVAAAPTKRDPTKLPQALAKLSDFKERYGKTAPILTLRALDTVARVHCEMGRLDEAMATYRTLRETDEKQSYAPRLLSRIFQAYSQEVKAREREHEAVAARAGAKPEEVAAAQERLDAARKAALACGMEYAATAEPPAYGVLYTALRYAAEPSLDAGDTAVDLGNRILRLYGNDPRHQKDIDQWVRLLLGEVLLRQRKFRAAYDMLREAEQMNPKNGALKRDICRALGGWYEIDERGRIVVVPGLDRQAEAYHKYWDEYRRWGLARDAAPDYSLPWYQFHWEAYSFASRAAEKDTSFIPIARTLYGIARSNDDFARLRTAFGADGAALYDLFAAYPPR